MGDLNLIPFNYTPKEPHLSCFDWWSVKKKEKKKLFAEQRLILSLWWSGELMAVTVATVSDFHWTPAAFRKKKK